jgi:hypothetical protein
VLTDLLKFPAPWFGGKQHAAPAVWSALGDVVHYVEGFGGTCAVLLRRPHPCNRTYYSETVNDADGFLVNALRCLQLRPDETAEAASWPVSECDLHARHLWLVRWAADKDFERLMGDPSYCDPQAGGWWLWGLSCWIGGGWCYGDGPWTADAQGRLWKQGRGPARAPGVARKRPHLANNGQGVNRPQARAPGVARNRPHLADDGRGVNHAGTRAPGVGEPEFHPMTMPELRRWFRFLSARLRHVRILCGDWRRAVTTGAALNLAVRQGKGPCGVFLDPPYADTAGRESRLYRTDSESVAHAVREWCLSRGEDKRYRIVLAGFEGEHGTALTDAGWREVEWFAAGHLRGGMGQTARNGDDDDGGPTHQQGRERLWLSPHCLRPDNDQPGLFDLETED